MFHGPLAAVLPAKAYARSQSEFSISSRGQHGTLIAFDAVKLSFHFDSNVLIFSALNHQVHQHGGAALGAARCSAATAGMTCNRLETELTDESLLSGELFLLGCVVDV